MWKTAEIPLRFEGGTNPRGAWLRLRNYGRRLIEKKEKDFYSNPLKSLSGGQFSPIPKSLLDQMAAMKLHKASTQHNGQAHHQNTNYSPSTQNFHTNSPQSQKVYQGKQGGLTIYKNQNSPITPHNNSHKRKQNNTINMEVLHAKEVSQATIKAGLEDKASHKQ
jgi:hypothetical protein